MKLLVSILVAFYCLVVVDLTVMKVGPCNDKPDYESKFLIENVKFELNLLKFSILFI